MPTKFFFPWLQVKQSFHIGAVNLIPYERGARVSDCFDSTQHVTDAILGNYGECLIGSPNGQPQEITRATIAEWQDDDASIELTDEEIAERLNLGQWVAFSALSCRRFGSHFGYCNADDLYFVAQRYDPTRPNVLATSMRRRDGSSVNYVSPQKYSPIFLRPPHSQASMIDLNVPLINALCNIDDLDLRVKILTAVSIFNRANTDASGFSQGSEITLMRVAFETLLETGFRAKALQDGFSSHFSLDMPNPSVWGIGKYPEAIWRGKYPKNVSRPLDAWVQDFCAVRNDNSHGVSGGSFYPAPIWSIHNHLLFSSWLFPLMVKKVLSDSGYYQLSDLDAECRARGEEFFAHDVLAQDADGRLYWTLVEDEMRLRELGRALLTLL